MEVDQQYITKAEFQDVYDHAGRTRATIRGFIKYLLSYEQGRQKSNPEPLNSEPVNAYKSFFIIAENLLPATGYLLYLPVLSTQSQDLH